MAYYDNLKIYQRQYFLSIWCDVDLCDVRLKTHSTILLRFYSSFNRFCFFLFLLITLYYRCSFVNTSAFSNQGVCVYCICVWLRMEMTIIEHERDLIQFYSISHWNDFHKTINSTQNPCFLWKILNNGLDLDLSD